MDCSVSGFSSLQSSVCSSELLTGGFYEQTPGTNTTDTGIPLSALAWVLLVGALVVWLVGASIVHASIRRPSAKGAVR